MSGPLRLLEVGELDFTFEPSRWPFAERRASSIAAHWARLMKAKPALFNGRVLLLGQRKIETGETGALTLRGAFFATDYADFLAWEEFGEESEAIDNCFSMAALRAADGAFLLGEMAPHTFNAGQIYFPAGTPDPTDIFDDKVDLEASARRELLEETGVCADEATVARGWTLVFTPRRIACMKLMTLSAPAAEAKIEIEAYLARSAGGILADAYRAPAGRHRHGPHAGLRRRIPARRVRSKYSRIARRPGGLSDRSGRLHRPATAAG